MLSYIAVAVVAITAMCIPSVRKFVTKVVNNLLIQCKDLGPPSDGKGPPGHGPEGPPPGPSSDGKGSESKKFCSKGEHICREYLERRFKKPFPNIRPSWIVNPETGRKLELDCYNEELKLACEYNGAQHYKFVKAYHKTHEDFEKQLFRDKIKEEACVNHKVFLITVPYTVPAESIEPFIEMRLKDFVH